MAPVAGRFSHASGAIWINHASVDRDISTAQQNGLEVATDRAKQDLQSGLVRPTASLDLWFA